MSWQQWFLVACLILSALIVAVSYALPPYLRSVRRWYDLVDAVEEISPELADQYRDHTPLHIRPLSRWLA